VKSDGRYEAGAFLRGFGFAADFRFGAGGGSRPTS